MTSVPPGLLRRGRKVPAAMDHASSFVSALEDTSMFEDAYDRAAAALGEADRNVFVRAKSTCCVCFYHVDT